MTYWIFVIMGSRDEFKKRMSSKKWPIFSNTAHKQRLAKNDDVIFYWGGKGNMVFIGRSKLGSALITESSSTSYVTLEDIDVWKQHMPIKKMMDELTLIGRKDCWGVYLQGGVIRLPEKDFTTILKKTI